MQLRNADVLLCAVEPQRERLLAALDALGPRAVGDRRPPVEVVAFGLPDDPPPSDLRPMRAHFPQIGADDTVVLWWGNVWRWFDAATALRAFARLAADRPGLRLVITDGRHPRRDWPVLDGGAEARATARPTWACSASACSSSTTGSRRRSATTTCSRPTSA